MKTYWRLKKNQNRDDDDNDKNDNADDSEFFQRPYVDQ